MFICQENNYEIIISYFQSFKIPNRFLSASCSSRKSLTSFKVVGSTCVSVILGPKMTCIRLDRWVQNVDLYVYLLNIYYNVIMSCMIHIMSKIVYVQFLNIVYSVDLCIPISIIYKHMLYEICVPQLSCDSYLIIVKL